MIAAIGGVQKTSHLWALITDLLSSGTINSYFQLVTNPLSLITLRSLSCMYLELAIGLTNLGTSSKFRSSSFSMGGGGGCCFFRFSSFSSFSTSRHYYTITKTTQNNAHTVTNSLKSTNFKNHNQCSIYNFPQSKQAQEQ